MRWLVLTLLLSSCGLTSLLPFGGSGGPTVNSNAQIGKENKQAAVTFEEEITAGRDVIQTTKEVENTIFNTFFPFFKNFNNIFIIHIPYCWREKCPLR